MKTHKQFLTLMVGILISLPSFSQLSKSQATDSLMINVIKSDSINFNVLLYPDQIQDSNFHLSSFHTLSCPYDSAWLFFVDMLPLAQWEHPCKYIFMNKITGDFVTINYKLPPNHYWDYWERVNYPFPYPEFFLPPDSLQMVNYPFTPDPHKYAVFICWNEVEPCRWNNMSHIYCGIKNNYGFTDENIFVLSGSGIINLDSVSNDLDGDLIYSDFDGPCTKDSIEKVMNHLSQVMSHEDVLFVYATTHGGTIGNDSSYLRLFGQDSIFDYELADLVDNIHCSQKIFGIDACFSGGFVNDLESDHTVIQTCVDGEIESIIDTAFGFHGMSFWWGTALRGKYPYSKLTPWVNGPNIGEHDSLYIISNIDSTDFNPDDTLGGNKDGFIQFQEVFNFAHHYAADIKIRNGQNYINEGFQGDLLTLNGIEGRVDTSQSILGDFLIGRKLTLAPGVVLSDSANYITHLNLFLNDSTEILVQDSATLNINGPTTKITGCLGQSFINIHGEISEENMNFDANTGASINVNFNNESKSYNLDNFDFENVNVNVACDSLRFEKSEFDHSTLEFTGNSLIIDNANVFDYTGMVLKDGNI